MIQLYLGGSFEKQFNSLQMRSKEREEILDYFKNYTDERAARDLYYKGEDLYMFKYHKYKDYRIFYSYCKECYGTYHTFFKCSHCDKNLLDKIVLWGAGHRSKLYGDITPDKIFKAKKL